MISVIRQHIPRLIALLTVMIALLGGLGSGLARLGWDMDPLSQNWLLIHGPLMISGFMGTLIALERAVALTSHYRWSIAVPAVNAIGALLLLIFGAFIPAKFILTLGSVGLVVLFGFMLKLHPSRDVWIMAAGAVCWSVGNTLWLTGQPVYVVVHLWVAFLILTIVGERLELSRVRRLTRRSENLLVAIIIIYLCGVIITPINLALGVRVLGVGTLFMSIWLLKYDIARRTIRQTALPRYIAACLLLGYIWLGFGGLLAFFYGAIYAGLNYAAVLHAFLLGFVFSMIFGHAPIILPALTSLKLVYSPVFYAHLALLHITLVLRMIANLTGNLPLREWGGLLNVVAILLFIAITAVTVIRSNLQVKTAIKSLL